MVETNEYAIRSTSESMQYPSAKKQENEWVLDKYNGVKALIFTYQFMQRILIQYSDTMKYLYSTRVSNAIGSR